MAGNGTGRLALLLLRRPLFVAAAALYGLYQLATRWGRWQPPGWAASWLADLLCMPVVLTLALAVQRAWRRQPRFTLPDSWLLAAWLYVSGWFELLAPLLRPDRYTADWLDVLAYGAGTLVFRRWLNRP
ncbi:hypothetical protein [Hymenobacter sp. B81]|uniref:hypothetical protein n=1 Tax=Hymenobacter sp. B81 TaxID=3344878 RepID=UPI0037DCE6E6